MAPAAARLGAQYPLGLHPGRHEGDGSSAWRGLVRPGAVQAWVLCRVGIWRNGADFMAAEVSVLRPGRRGFRGGAPA